MTNGPTEDTLDLMREEWRTGCTGRLLRPIRQSLQQLEAAAPAMQTAGLLSELQRYLGQYESDDLVQRRAQVEFAAERLKVIADQLRLQSGPLASIGINPDADRVPKRVRTRPAPHSISLRPEDPIARLKGVGSAMEKRLSVLGISTVGELLHHFPRAYVDFSSPKPIGQVTRLEGDSTVTIAGILSEIRVIPGPRTKRVEATLTDNTGWARLVWFNPYLAYQLHVGDHIVVHGPTDRFPGALSLTSPEWQRVGHEATERNRLVPIYPLTQGVGQAQLRRLSREALERTRHALVDPMPGDLLQRYQLRGRPWAIEQLHFPGTPEALADARRRMAFDEMMLLQLGLIQRKREVAAITGNDLSAGRDLVAPFVKRLPYQLTNAQLRAIRDVGDDLARPNVMQRLIQGDVGSGKTIVAAAAILQSVEAGFQSAVMAPTEILARQLYSTLSDLLVEQTDGRMRIELLTGSTKKRDRTALLENLEAGEVDVLVGTHALIQEGVLFNRLGLTVVDEQHRFGVRQRGELPSRGQVAPAHILTMSATPIPRSLQLVLLGDIDVSVIDEMPPGREPVITKRFIGAERERAYNAVRQEVAKGRQAFVICPLVDESEDSDKRSAVAEATRLQRDVFPNLRIDLLHGRMAGSTKDAVMNRFRNGEIDVLVSTSVIEVGIDIPNATVMVIEGADQFGLSQLHQFRGRVGRGGGRSYCLLLADEATVAGEERLRMMESTTDGFKLAEADLRMRGPGDFLGTRQSGLPELSLLRTGFDSRLLTEARSAAAELLDADPGLAEPRHALLRAAFDQFWQTSVSSFAGA